MRSVKVIPEQIKCLNLPQSPTKKPSSNKQQDELRTDKEFFSPLITFLSPVPLRLVPLRDWKQLTALEQLQRQPHVAI